MSRIPWERYGGDDVEAVVAIMLLRDIPQAQRIRPSKGDGGIDVLVPLPDGRWEIYQVKGFAKSLNSSHKTQIRNSWNRVLKFAKGKANIAAWHVVRPIDPTHEDREWLEELTAGEDFPSDWVGLTTIDGWAARYPEVVDYYLGDGRERLESSLQRLASGLSLIGAGTAGTLSTPAQSVEGLGAIYSSINALDPHFRYEFHVTSAGSHDLTVIPDGPGYLGSFSKVVGDVAVQVDTYARYPQATEDRPIPISVSFTPTAEDQKRAWDDFLRFGTSVHEVPAQILSADLPGGFEVIGSGLTQVSIVSRHSEKKLEYELTIIGPDGEALASIPMIMAAPTSGVDQKGGIAWRGQDATGMLTIEVRSDPARDYEGLFASLRGAIGQPAAAAAAALQRFALLCAGNSIRLSVPYGPPAVETTVLRADLIDMSHVRMNLEICQPLADIQRHTTQRLVLPRTPEEVSRDDVNSWRLAANLLNGHWVTRRWASLGMSIPSGESVKLPCRIRLTIPLVITLAGEEIELGYYDQLVTAARWEPTEMDDRKGHLFPGEDDRLHQYLAKDVESAQHRAQTGVIQSAALEAVPVPEDPPSNSEQEHEPVE